MGRVMGRVIGKKACGHEGTVFQCPYCHCNDLEKRVADQEAELVKLRKQVDEFSELAVQDAATIAVLEAQLKTQQSRMPDRLKVLEDELLEMKRTNRTLIAEKAKIRAAGRVE